jgi:3-hydroxyacyl-[acyl-carrier-protein] dehydratase
MRAIPLVAVDTIDAVSATEVLATKLIRQDDAYLPGHYPDFTIFPGVFVIESVLQAVRGMVEQRWPASTGLELELTQLRSVRFTAPLLAGDTLRLRCLCNHLDNGLLRVQADCRTGDGAKAARLTADLRLVRSAAGV